LKVLSAYQSTGLSGELPLSRYFVACWYGLIGLFDRAEEAYAAVQVTSPAGSMNEFMAGTIMALVRVDQRRLPEAASLAAWVVREAQLRGELLIGRAASLVSVRTQLLSGELEAADAAINALAVIDREEPHLRISYLTIFAGIRLAQGRAAEASELAERAYAQCLACGMGYVLTHAVLLLVRAEAREAIGDRIGAREAIREARDDLLRRAAKIPDPHVHRAFLDNFPEHQRTLALAQQWLGDPGR
jgi:hypothetical protein